MVCQDATFEVTCFLTGHGPFNAELKRLLGLSEHLLINCAIHETERNELIRKVGIRNLMIGLFYTKVLFNNNMY